MNLPKVFFATAVVCTLAGCATVGKSTLNYQPPTQTTRINNTIVVNKPFDAVWDQLVGQLATGFFVINNIDKASRLINLSFSTNEPEKYVNCGHSTRHFKFRKQSRDFNYAVASSSEYKAAGKWGVYKNLPAVYDISRHTSLDGRINIYVAPVSSSKTKVSANVKYIMTLSVTGVFVGYNAFGGLQTRQRIPQSKDVVSFTTQQEGSSKSGAGAPGKQITCHATGALEASLLSEAQS